MPKNTKRKVTIKDIARLSGVGISTVSRIVNRSREVKPENYKRVMEVIERLDYKPNKIARQLVSGDWQPNTIGIVFPVVISNFFFEMLKGIYEGLQTGDYSPIIFNEGEDRNRVFEHIQREVLAGTFIVANPLEKNEKALMKQMNLPWLYMDYYEE
ncbi:MAG: LacI family DNA-binding transcriptional regulator, partial [Spirochaetia bacterium]